MMVFEKLPPPEVIARGIIDDLDAALEESRSIDADLGGDSGPGES